MRANVLVVCRCAISLSSFASLYNEHERNIWTLSAVELRMKQNEMDSYVKLAKFLVLLDKR